MAETGDPDPSDRTPTPTRLDDEDVGFAASESLAERAREVAARRDEPDLFDGPPMALAAEPDAPVPTLDPPPAPANAPADGMMGLYAVYALILFAVPTLGVSALIGLVAVTRRETPDDALARSHFIYQQRTLWAAAVIALLGAILIVVNIGVFVLFVLALWILLRGAAGVLRLKAGRGIDRPRHWLI